MTQPHDIAALIDAYLDGDMSPQDRDAFERRAAGDAELQRQLDLQKKIDIRLRVLMEVPAYAPAAPAPSTTGVAGTIAPRRPFAPHWMAIAAVLVLGLIGVWALVSQPWGGIFGTPRSETAANTYLKRVVDAGFKPDWVCENDEVFRKHTRDTLGVPFTVDTRPGVQLVGWKYTPGLLASTAQVLLVRVDGQPEMVVIGKGEDDRKVYVDRSSGMKVHRKACAGLVFYEVSARDDTPVLDGVQAPGCK